MMEDMIPLNMISLLLELTEVSGKKYGSSSIVGTTMVRKSAKLQLDDDVPIVEYAEVRSVVKNQEFQSECTSSVP